MATPPATKPPGHTTHPLLPPALLLSPQDCLAANPAYDGLIASALVIRAFSVPVKPNPIPKILLLQRAPTDSMPLRWEAPGGAVDVHATDAAPADGSIVAACARELWEEAGLAARVVGPLVGEGPQVFFSRRGARFGKWSFLVDVVVDTEAEREVKVTLDPKEHVEFVWASEEEVRAGRCGEVGLQFTSADQWRIALEAFRVWGGLKEM